MKTSDFVMLVTCIVLSHGKLVADIYNLSTTAVYNCIKNSGYSNMYVRVQSKNITLDPNAIQTLTNINNIGITPDIQLLVCRNKSPTQIVDPIIKNIPRSLYKNIWLEIDMKNTSPVICLWQLFNKTDNCQYLKSIMTEFKKYGEVPGIHIQVGGWNITFNGNNACHLDQMVPLGYGTNDGVPDFSGFVPFGMWAEPNRKRYGSDSVCGLDIGLNYVP